ncbi:hypothetical protein MFIFM68171_05144 [Madurella fahalii]|uniref:HypA n=1 Tax=Madurella fahalii TaxID=1157608 RepID=A0ABQ0GAZ9_9PEZI
MSINPELPYKMHVTPDNTGLWHIKQTEEAARKTSELLQQDLEAHHVFFNKSGFHNHIPHHLLALYGTGAAPPALQAAYDGNAHYQRPALPTHGSSAQPLEMLPWPKKARAYLGKEEYYPDFLRLFQDEMKRKSTAAEGAWQAVVREYLLERGRGGDELLVRLFAGFLHPLIQLMYGVEWHQEAIVAEALAQAAVHSDDIKGYLLGAEEAASKAGAGARMPRIVDLLQEVRQNEKLAGSVRMQDENKIRDGVLVRAKEEMIRLAARVRVAPVEVEERTAEMFDACVYMASAAALIQPEKHPKFDFFLMHHVNASPIFVTLNAQDWIPPQTKARLLEWKIRMDLLQYAARGVPELLAEKLAAYQPRKPGSESSLAEIIARLHEYADDGHAIKLGRATVVCHNICKGYEAEGKNWLKVKGDDMWTKVCHLIVDSVEAPGPVWVRSCGLEEAWNDVPDVQDAKL